MRELLLATGDAHLEERNGGEAYTPNTRFSSWFSSTTGRGSGGFVVSEQITGPLRTQEPPEPQEPQNFRNLKNLQNPGGLRHPCYHS